MSDLLNYFNNDELAASTWKNKYAAPGENTPDDTHKRLAKEFSRIEEKYSKYYNYNRNNLSNYGQIREYLSEDKIFDLFRNFKYIIPGGSVMAGCGTNQLVSLSNCFVIGSPKDSYADIMNTRNQQVQLMKRRGGVGYDLSNLRPKGSFVNNAAKTSTGAASFMEVCSDITNEVAQNGRRGALMLSLNINHPDIEEFITKKQDLTKVTGANISVQVTDKFMNAVLNNEDYYLRYPIDIPDPSENIKLDKYNELIHVYDTDWCGYYKKIKARELWTKLMHCAWNTAEPGILFQDTLHNFSPDGRYDKYKMVCTNPCGEIPMGAFDSCRLIHLNLTSFVINPFLKNAKINFSLLYKIAYEAMRLADDLVDLEIEAVDKILNVVKKEENDIEFKLWSKINNTARMGRRAGLGFTGLADLLAMINIKYDSNESYKIINYIMETIFIAELDANIDMSIERGAFPDWDGDKEKVTSLDNNDWYNWLSIKYPNQYSRMQEFGRRNISFSTVAPTGTVSIMAGCSSGIEPVFLPYYQRRRKCMSSNDRIDFTDKTGENFTIFYVFHPNFIKWYSIIYNINSLSDAYEILNTKSEEELNTIFKQSPYYGSTASEINWRKRVKIQGIIQKYITHSISSTINLPKETKEEEIADIYIEAWKTGNKGQTIYRDGCRDGVLMKIEKPKVINNTNAPKRPKDLEADYYQIKVKGEQFIVLVGLLQNRPYEIFTLRPTSELKLPQHKGIITKKGKMNYVFNSNLLDEELKLSNTNSNIEEKAATLYSSMLLRHGVDIKYIIKTAKKVNDNISSFSSAMCRILSKYTETEATSEKCPNCGGTLIRECGCVRCLDCDYSKCL